MTNQTTPSQTGILASTSITAGSDGREQNHGEDIVVSTGLEAGINGGYPSQQHAEGIVVSTAITAGSGNGGLATNHGEGLVR